MSEPFLAEIRMMGFNFAPRGWAFLDGQILPINQNQSLYSLLGSTYGGDGARHLPCRICAAGPRSTVESASLWGKKAVRKRSLSLPQRFRAIRTR